MHTLNTDMCSQTKSGRKCQKWNQSYPHKPNDQMANHVIELTGSSNHNYCARADENDPKAWCYTVDSKQRWEHCSPMCSGGVKPTQRPPSTRPPSTRPHPLTGKRQVDVEEQIPQIDKRSKYDRNGKCIASCNTRSIVGTEIEQCGRYDCREEKPHWARILNWLVPDSNACHSTNTCDDPLIIGGVPAGKYQVPWQV